MIVSIQVSHGCGNGSSLDVSEDAESWELVPGDVEILKVVLKNGDSAFYPLNNVIAWYEERNQ